MRALIAFLLLLATAAHLLLPLGTLQEANAIEAEIKRRGRDYKTTPAQFLDIKPSYFNSGCCCFRDGDITGIEITYKKMTLVKWSLAKKREVLEEITLEKLQALIK